MDSGPAPRRMAVCGWDDQAVALLAAFEDRGQLRPVAVADRSTHALVRARRETTLPCFRHPLEMLRTAEVEAVLALSGADLPAIAEIAAERGLDLFVLADRIAGADLAGAAEAASGSGRLRLLRPRLRSSGLDFLVGLVDVQPEWRPDYLELTLEDDAPVEALMRDAAALLARVMEDVADHVVASGCGPLSASPAVAAEFRYDAQRVASVRVRSGPNLRIALFAHTPRGRIELDTARRESRLRLGADQQDETASRLRDGNLVALEVERVTGATARPDRDDLLAPSEAATLRALEFALETGYVAPVAPPERRSALRLLHGGAGYAPGRARLHLVGS